jgi:RNA polymerase sigma-70 factor (ECF subfamily)
LSRNIDANLIENAIRGDAAAFNEVYMHLRNPVYGFANRMLGVNSAAEDITQETFIFFIEHPEKYLQERGSLLAFLCGVARHRIMHYLRKNHNRMEICMDAIDDYVEPIDEARRDPLKVLLDNEIALKIEESIAMLPPLQREVLILREIQELSYEEIAKIIEANTSTVKIRLYRARRTLACRLAPYISYERKNYHAVL